MKQTESFIKQTPKMEFWCIYVVTSTSLRMKADFSTAKKIVYK